MKPKYSLCILFLIYGLSFGQTESAHGFPMAVSEMAESVASGGPTTIGNMPIQSLDTGVYLYQVGDRNSATADISGKQIELQLTQQGSDNFLGIRATAKTVEGNLVQTGNNNFAFDFADDPTLPLFLNLDQHGDGHHFESHGINSIGNKLKFNMTGNSQMIIVRNFK